MNFRQKPVGAEDEALFRLALKDTKPLKQRPRIVAEPKRSIVPRAPAPRESAFPAYNERPAPAIGGHADAHMRRGRIEPDARLDLHGLSQSAAYRALLRFLMRAQTEGIKFVLVITGKGGVLRQALPLWLGQPELHELVGGLNEAHAKHGGGGAFYVAIRKPKRTRQI